MLTFETNLETKLIESLKSMTVYKLEKSFISMLVFKLINSDEISIEPFGIYFKCF